MNERITTNLKTNHTKIKFSAKLNIVFENWAAQVSVSQVSIGQNSKIILLLAHQFVLFHNNTGINMWMTGWQAPLFAHRHHSITSNRDSWNVLSLSTFGQKRSVFPGIFQIQTKHKTKVVSLSNSRCLCFFLCFFICQLFCRLKIPGCVVLSLFQKDIRCRFGCGFISKEMCFPNSLCLRIETSWQFCVYLGTCYDKKPLQKVEHGILQVQDGKNQHIGTTIHRL